MPLDQNAAEPLYMQLAAELRVDITAGRYSVGSRIPSESALMKQHGVSRITVRQALDLLKDEGRVESRQGRGTFVLTGARRDSVPRGTSVGGPSLVARVEYLEKRVLDHERRLAKLQRQFAGRMDPVKGII